jgi:hypothetical protein
MKKLIVGISFFFFTSAVFSQEITTPSPPLTKQDYLQKSKRQKTGGFILLGVGATMIAIAAPGTVSFDVVPVLAIGGSAAVLGSIPLFIAAGKNKRRAKAMTAYFDMQQIPTTLPATVLKHSYPAVTLRLNL